MVVSFIGLETQEVTIKPTVNVVLRSDAEQLDEVVVTAMGIKRSEKALGENKMNASGVNQYLSPARSAATACAYSCPYSTERSGRMFPFILMQTKRRLPVESASKSQLLRFLFRIKVPPHSCLSYYYLYLYCHVIDYST